MCESCEAGAKNSNARYTVVASDSKGETSGEFDANNDYHAAYVAGAVAAGAALGEVGIIGEIVMEALMPWFIAIRDADLYIDVYEI